MYLGASEILTNVSSDEIENDYQIDEDELSSSVNEEDVTGGRIADEERVDELILGYITAALDESACGGNRYSQPAYKDEEVQRYKITQKQFSDCHNGATLIVYVARPADRELVRCTYEDFVAIGEV